MAVFRVERNSGYTVMSNHHLRNKELTLKAKGLLSQKPCGKRFSRHAFGVCGVFLWKMRKVALKA